MSRGFINFDAANTPVNASQPVLVSAYIRLTQLRVMKREYSDIYVLNIQTSGMKRG
jgi:hypothetical protein